MKIFFGGSFDPIHIGHIKLALQIAQEFDEQVSFLPISGIPNYKTALKTSEEQRLAMLKLVCNKYPMSLNIDYNELDNKEYSPSYFTLQRLRKIYGINEPFYFIIGADSLSYLDSWDNWLDLFDLTNFIVAQRSEYSIEKLTLELQNVIVPRIIEFDKNNQTSAGKIIFSKFAPVQISSTKIRQMIIDIKNINCWLDEDVYKYIITNNLYKGN